MSDQPLTDSFGRKHTYLRISVTDRCNLRCTYCMPEEGIEWTPPPHILSTEEIVRIATLFVDMGITKIRLTGGEPLLRSSIGEIARRLRLLPHLKTLALTTNGIGLTKWAVPLAQTGLDSVTISLDTLKRDRFLQISRRDRFDDVMKGIDAALKATFSSVKINIVVMKGINDDEILDFIDWGRNKPIDLRFIEYMPFPDTKWSESDVVSYAMMKALIADRYELISLQGDPSDVGKRFWLKGYAAHVSFITSMSQSFCGACNRLRLTADGNLKSCLFHPDERSLRELIRDGSSDDAIRARIQSAVFAKQREHAAMIDLPDIGNRSMIAIGG